MFAGLETDTCPVANLPDERVCAGAGLTVQKMADCRWLRPVLLGEFEFVEEIPKGHLWHPKFIRLASTVPGL